MSVSPARDARSTSGPAPPAVSSTSGRPPEDRPLDPIVLATRELAVWYGAALALKDITFDIPRNKITALIGPSGCGKSTLLRCFNRMNDLIPGARMEGEVRFDGDLISGPDIDAVALRRRIGMVFQKPNPFPKSVYNNVAWAHASTDIAAIWTNWSSARSAAPRSGMRSRISSIDQGSIYRAASSSGSASRALRP